MKRFVYVFLLIFLAANILLTATVVDVLNHLQVRIAQSETDSLLIVRNGKTAFKFSQCQEFPRLNCREMKRPILALAIGLLRDERYITSLDTLVSTFCPSWEEGVNEKITIRMLLSDEGECFYRLSEVIQAITQDEWHHYVQRKLFNPLGIDRSCWVSTDNHRIELFLSASELAQIGLLLLRNGEWKGKQLLSRCWIDSLKTPTDHVNPFLSMQWALEYFDFSTYWDKFLLNQYRSCGLNHSMINRLGALNGRVVHLGGLAIRGKLIHAWGRDIFCALGGEAGLSTLISETYCHKLPFGYFNGGGVKSLVAWGAGGQQLIIMPNRQLIGIRQKNSVNGADRMEDFIEILDDYARECDCYID